MNKQALAFLTMFSLILMLSVYYVTLPSDTTTVMKETDVTKESAKVKEKNTSKVNEADQLQEKINEKKDEEMNKQSSHVADKKKNEDEKKDALEQIDALSEEKKLQQKIIDELAKDHIKCAVEIKETTCIITVFEQKDDAKLANKIMQKANKITNQKYFLEVAFK